MDILLVNGKLVQDGKITPCDILVTDGAVAEIRPAGGLAMFPCRSIDLGGLYLCHGFIDIHVHGGGGSDFMDNTTQAYQAILDTHLRHGTTALLATTVASSPEKLLAATKAYNRAATGVASTAKLLGLHLEGPYLALGQAGAMEPCWLREPDPAEYRRILDICPGVRRWTAAPELLGALEMGDFLSRRQVLPSAGHSDATLYQMREAAVHGYRHLTHLYSAMSTIVRRQGYRYPGLVESAYLLDELTSEVIADGHHLPKELLQIAFRSIGPRRLCLVTDAMRGAGLPDGESVLGGLDDGAPVIVEDGVAKLPDRSAFAGSVATADTLLRTMVETAGVPLANTVEMMTATPARIMGVDAHMGSLLPGRCADITCFDDGLRVRLVMVDGKVRHETL